MVVRPNYTLETLTNEAMRFALRSMRVAKIHLDNGQEKRWEGLQAGDTALVVAFTRQGALRLAELFRYMPGERVVELPGGTVKKNEPSDVAALRELLEETGCMAKNVIPLGWTYLDTGLHNGRAFVFLALGCHEVKEPVLDVVEHHAGLVSFDVPLVTVFKNLLNTGESRYTDPNLGDGLFKALLYLARRRPFLLAWFLGRSTVSHLLASR